MSDLGDAFWAVSLHTSGSRSSLAFARWSTLTLLYLIRSAKSSIKGSWYNSLTNAPPVIPLLISRKPLDCKTLIPSLITGRLTPSSLASSVSLGSASPVLYLPDRIAFFISFTTSSYRLVARFIFLKLVPGVLINTIQ